jgi:hypothetical protein
MYTIPKAITDSKLVGTVVRFYVSRPGGRAIQTGTVLLEYPESVLVSVKGNLDSIPSVRKRDLIGVKGVR